MLLTGSLALVNIASAQQNVGQWDRFEAAVTNTKTYTSRYRDVTLNVTYTKPDGNTVNFWGFYDGNSVWRFRFMPDQLGTWTYRASFSDGTPGVNGTFNCVPSTIPGMISKDEINPRWFGFKGGKHTLLRSFHGGPPLLAFDFPDASRKSFLDWVNQQGYNMLSVNDFNETGYDIPNLWPLNAAEYRQIEKVLNNLAARKIIFYSFGGLLPRDESLPGTEADEILLVKYYLARLAPYWNIVFNVSGAEANIDGYISSTKINRVGAGLKARDVFGHIIGNHNKDGNDPYRNQLWSGYATPQVEMTDLSLLNNFFLANHTGTKPVYAQESLWPGNIYQPSGSFDATTIRKHAWAHLFSAVTLNYGDMNGKNNSGFSASLNLTDKIQSRHDVVDKVWDFMETVPFYKMNPSQSLVTNGLCLAQPGQQYIVYLPAPGTVNIAIETGKTYAVKWINGQNPLQDQRQGANTTTGQGLTSPSDGDDWLVYLTLAPEPNQAPVASFTASPTTGVAPLAVTFDAAASGDPDGNIASYKWTYGDGNTGSGVTSNHTYSQAGTYTATLTVTDNGSPALSKTKSVTITVNAPSTTTSAIRINAGGPAYLASDNRQFTADAYYGGIDRVGNTTTSAIANTADDKIYQTNRSSGAFSYNVPVTNGTVNVVLHFAEIYFTASGKRKFNVDIEGSRKLTNYDIFATAGGAYRAVQARFAVTVNDGELNINFTSGTVNWPKISAIEVLPGTASLSVKAETEAEKSRNSPVAAKASLQIYPNSNEGRAVTIKIYSFKAAETITLSLYDMQGRLIKTRQVVTDKSGGVTTAMSFPEKLNRGNYMLVASSLTQKVSGKLLVW